MNTSLRTQLTPLMLSQISLIFIVTGAFSMIAGCGGPAQTSSEDIRKRLRANADRATAGVSRKRPLERQQQKVQRDRVKRRNSYPTTGSNIAPSRSLPPHVSCLQQASCFPRAHYLVAEGLGSNIREAEIDASSRLSAKISSEVSSTVRMRTSEGDGQESKTAGEIEQTVKSNFKRGELIRFIEAEGALEGADRQSSIRVFAYLAKTRYREEVERELERPLRGLGATVRSLQDEKSPEVFVRMWQDFVIQRNAVEAPLVEYRAVMGVLPQGYQEIKPKIVALERAADQRRREAHFIIEFSGAELGRPKMRTLLRGLIRQLGPRVSSPGTCLRGNYLMKVESAVENQVHQLTGGALKKLRWGVTMYECGVKAQDLREIGQRAFPVISGVERYNLSADQVVVRQLKSLVDLSKSNTKAKKRRVQDQMDEVREVIKSLTSLVVPTI